MDEKEVSRADEVIVAFARLWPKCFFAAPEERKPLMLHIHVQLHKHLQPMIEARRISERDIQIALSRYTACGPYQDRIAATGPTMRIGLHGEERGHVTHEERMFARKTRAEAALAARNAS